MADSCSGYAERSKLTPHCCKGTTTIGEVLREWVLKVNLELKA